MSCSATVLGQDILCNVIVSGNVTFSQISKLFCTYIIFSLLTKCLREPDEMLHETDLARGP